MAEKTSEREQGLDSLLLHLTLGIALDTGTATFLCIPHRAESHALHLLAPAPRTPKIPCFPLRRARPLGRARLHQHG
jgi:hypothetical protein